MCGRYECVHGTSVCHEPIHPGLVFLKLVVIVIVMLLWVHHLVVGSVCLRGYVRVGARVRMVGLYLPHDMRTQHHDTITMCVSRAGRQT